MSNSEISQYRSICQTILNISANPFWMLGWSGNIYFGFSAQENRNVYRHCKDMIHQAVIVFTTSQFFRWNRFSINLENISPRDCSQLQLDSQSHKTRLFHNRIQLPKSIVQDLPGMYRNDFSFDASSVDIEIWGWPSVQIHGVIQNPPIRSFTRREQLRADGKFWIFILKKGTFITTPMANFPAKKFQSRVLIVNWNWDRSLYLLHHS